jgi:hypothetical protein
MADVKKILNDYKNIGNIEKVAQINKIGKKKVKELLLENNINLNQKGGQLKFNIKKFPKIEPTNSSSKVIAICKKTGKQFNDPNDKSGAIKKHIRDQLKISYPSLNERRKYYSQNRRYWFQEYFILREINEEAKRACKKCGWETTDVNNKTGAFETHINRDHPEYDSIDSYLKDFPEDKVFHPTTTNKQRYEQDLKYKNYYITCQLCFKKFKKITESHLKAKHNISLPEYRNKFGQTSSNQLIEKSKQHIYHNVNKWGHISFTSKGEQEIKNFIETELGFECDKRGNRSLLDGMEIDGLIKNTGICFEYNGNRWHTEKFGINKWYHWHKTEACLKQGYKLIHIFEDEWEYKKNIVKDIFRHKLGVKNEKVFARKTIVQNISLDSKNNFLNANHIQGEDKSSFYFGAFYNNELLGVMTFKRKGNGEYELGRVSIKIGLHCPGLISKLLKYFIWHVKPKKIVTFADRRFAPSKSENLYNTLNFRLVKTLNPDYKYFHPKTNDLSRHHKFGFRKKHLKRKYGFDSSMTEKEMTEKLGYERIWDCGLLKYEMTF